MQAGVDIKDVWEPARFRWLYDLARYVALTDDPVVKDVLSRFAYDRVQDWWISNVPYKGVHWACGQEVAIRAIALTHTEQLLFGRHQDQLILDILAAAGERIADGIGYAISQRNNHALSEAAGLICIGVRLKGVHPNANRWLETGQKLFQQQLLDQFATDGWYIQHSLNYARLALQVATAAQVALRSIGRSLDAGSIARVEAGASLLARLMDPSNGEVPNHGANDGAILLPFTTSSYPDFRPALQLIRDVFDIEVSTSCDPLVVGASGWVSIHAGKTRLFLRAPNYKSRPSHSDCLHLDIRHNGQAIVIDAGTVAYNAPPPWNNSLAGGAVHNAPVADEQDLGMKGPRFLWWLWPQARIERAESANGQIVVAASAGDIVRREIRLPLSGDFVEIEDHAIKSSTTRLSVHWLFSPSANLDCIETTPAGAAKQGSVEDPFAVYSPSYGARVAAPSVNVVADRKSNHGLSVKSRIRFVGIPSE